MKPRLWSEAELSALQFLLDNNADRQDIYKAFPYRTTNSISHKMRGLKNRSTQLEAEDEALKPLIDQLRTLGPIAPPPIHQEKESDVSRELEVCLMDPHFGMQCFTPESDHPWDMELAEDVCFWAIESLLELAEPFGPFERIVFPFGNDFLHADNIQHTTTKGTLQPEMVSWHEAYRRGKILAIKMVERLKNVAPVKIYQIPGNHSVQSDYTLGLLLDAYYHQDGRVEVDASSSPYKFHRFGANLIGYEHGHSVATIRLAALMANSCPRDWAETSYHEFHLGDQHRKGSSVPAALEEQGVSVEYLAGLTPPNYWHKTHSFNFQKRGATAFVWDRYKGQVAKLMCNMDNKTGKPMRK